MYYKIWPDLLELIKQGYLRESDISAAEFQIGSEKESFKKNFFLNDFRNNFIVEPMEKHSNELGIFNDSKEFSYIGSKKALCFNLFGNDSICFKKNSLDIAEGWYNINYMQRMPIIRGKNFKVVADAVLYNEENKALIVSRVRLLEWIVLKNENIKEQFLDRTNYLTPSAGKVFTETIKELLSLYGNDGMGYSGKYCDFDSLHVIKKIIAAYNLMDTYSGIINVNQLTILDTYWKPQFYENLDQYAGRVYQKEKNMINEANEMIRSIGNVRDLFFKEFNAKLNICCVDIWKLLASQIRDKDQIKWMNRFIV